MTVTIDGLALAKIWASDGRGVFEGAGVAVAGVSVGAKVAVAHFFGQKLQKSKKTGTSNWASPNLSERQLLYAANDAHVALRLYRAWLLSGPQED